MALSNERMKELMDFIFGERLRKMRAGQGSTPSAVELPPLPPVAEQSRKRKRDEISWTETDDLEEEYARRRRPVAPRWTGRPGDTPLLEGARNTPPPPWYGQVRPITICFGENKTSFWSGSNERNEHPRAAASIFIGGFEFPADHYYVIDFLRGGYVSVSGFLHHFFADFDAKRDLLASFCLRTIKPESPYYSMKTKQEVFDYWDKIRDNGTCYHAAIDDTLQGRPLRAVYQVGKSDAIKGPPPGFARFMTDYPELEVYFTEFTVFDRTLMLVGQFDGLFWHRVRKCFILVDWKNVMTFRMRSTEKGTDPLSANMDDCHLSHYSLQLNLYRALLERRYGFDIAEMWIVNFPAFQHAGAPYQRIPVTRQDMNPFFARCPITAEGRSRKNWAPGEMTN